jgi:hypothetical protein
VVAVADAALFYVLVIDPTIVEIAPFANRLSALPKVRPHDAPEENGR